MITPKDIAANFARSADMIRNFTNGLNHAQSLAQPALDGNCLNWVVGHILNSRNTLLRLTGAADKQWQDVVPWEALRARYGNGSQPIRADGADVLQLSQLLDGLTASQTQINAVLGAISSEAASAEIEALGRKLALDHFWIYMFGHEQYHTGQLEYTRPLSGLKNP
jgi:hypothetical protein